MMEWEIVGQDKVEFSDCPARSTVGQLQADLQVGTCAVTSRADPEVSAAPPQGL
jgi:hypothetical protein